MTLYLGDFPTSHTAVCIPFDSFAAATGAPSAVTNFANTDVLIYKDGGTTQRSSAAGITVSTSFDSQTGLQMIVIDTSDNTDAGFYAAGHEYQVGVADITVDSQTVRFWAATFSIERAGGVLALIKANTIKVDVNTIKTQTVTCAAGVTVLASVGTAATSTAQTGDNYARIGAPAGASVSADIAAVKSDSGAIKAKTDSLTFTVAGVVDANALRVGGTVQTARDLGASVLISSGSGTGQLDVTSGVIKANLAQILGTALTETAGQIAAAFKQFFDVASPTGTMKAITNVVTATNLTTNNDKTGYALTAAYDLAKTAAQAGDAMALTSGERDSTADALLDRDMSTGTDSGSPTVRTVRQALRALRNKLTIVGTGLTVYKEDDTTSSWTGTVGTTPGADPITSNDPA